MQLPGGVIIEAGRIIQEATTEIAELEAFARNTYEAPVDFYVG
jgi:hypothetical protein